MNEINEAVKLQVTSEIGLLRKVMIHSPDGGVGNVPTSKIHDWLYDDIVDVRQMQKEYNFFIRILLLFLDPNKLFKKTENELEVFSPNNIKFNPEHEEYFGNDNFNNSCVIDTQYCLAHIFSIEEKERFTYELISSISAIEGLHIDRKRDLEKLYKQAIEDKELDGFQIGKSKFMDLVKTFITGKLEWVWDKQNEEVIESNDSNFIFPPIANFIFTRDIGVAIKDRIFITKPRFYIRKREVVLLKFIVEHFLLKNEKDAERIIEIGEEDDFFQIEDSLKDESRVSFEGGDIMMISKEHILIGCSERTSPYAIHKFIHRVFAEKLAQIISVIKISEKRSQMHIDTILSHLKKDTWIMFGQLSEEWQKSKQKKGWYRYEYADSIRQKSEDELKKEKPVTITQFFCGGNYSEKQDYQVYIQPEIDLMGKKGELDADKTYQIYNNVEGFKYEKPKGLEDLLRQISVNDFNIESKDKVKFIYSGGGVPPHDEREQWTDACNLLVIKEGIAIGYDRNKKTAQAFENLMLGFKSEDTPLKVELEEKRKTKINSNEKIKDFLKWLKKKYNDEREKQNRKQFSEIFELNFHLILAEDLIEYFRDDFRNEPNKIKDFVENLEDTLILLPSNELSRARGGSHCMSMPLWREEVN